MQVALTAAQITRSWFIWLKVCFVTSYEFAIINLHSILVVEVLNNAYQAVQALKGLHKYVCVRE